eukprot:COSAG01_NODE_18516_length_1071_cov_0.948560_2_plen_80_part_01
MRAILAAGGIECDISIDNLLAVHNTQLIRACVGAYSHAQTCQPFVSHRLARSRMPGTCEPTSAADRWHWWCKPGEVACMR